MVLLRSFDTVLNPPFTSEVQSTLLVIQVYVRRLEISAHWLQTARVSYTGHVYFLVGQDCDWLLALSNRCLLQHTIDKIGRETSDIPVEFWVVCRFQTALVESRFHMRASRGHGRNRHCLWRPDSQPCTLSPRQIGTELFSGSHSRCLAAPTYQRSQRPVEKQYQSQGEARSAVLLERPVTGL
jgi:hypothetical protein